MKKLLTSTVLAAVLTVAVNPAAFAEETQKVSSIKFVYGSSACKSGGICEAREIPTPPEYFMVFGLSIIELNNLNELIEIRAGHDIPPYTFVRMKR
jgi:hypothetical protein